MITTQQKRVSVSLSEAMLKKRKNQDQLTNVVPISKKQKDIERNLPQIFLKNIDKSFSMKQIQKSQDKKINKQFIATSQQLNMISDNKYQIFRHILNEANSSIVYQQILLAKRGFNSFLVTIKFGDSQIRIQLSQIQRQNLLNQMKSENIHKFSKKLLSLIIQQNEDKKQKLNNQDEQKIIYDESKLKTLPSEQFVINFQSIRMLEQQQYQYTKDESKQDQSQNKAQNQIIESIKEKKSIEISKQLSLNNLYNLSLDLSQSKLNHRLHLQQNQQKCKTSQRLIQDEMITVDLSFRNNIELFSKNKLLGGGGSCCSQNQKVRPQKLDKQHNKLDKNNLNQIQGLQKDRYFEEDPSTKQTKDQNQNNQLEIKQQDKRQTFNTHYEMYFTNDKVEEDEIETHIRLIIEEGVYRYRERIVSSEIRYKVIDLINLIINYLIIVIQKQDTQSLQDDIDELESKLKRIKKYCEENRKRYPCLDLYQYMDILISLNSQRKGLDRVNQSAVSKIAQKIVQVAKFGAGFVSISGAIKNMTEIDFGDLKRFIKEVQDIYSQITSSSSAVLQGPEIHLDIYKKGNLQNQICTLWLRKIQKIGDSLLDTHQEIIFYLEEKVNLQNQELIHFVYMQLNYLLTKSEKIDNFKELSQILIREKKEQLVIDFANELQLKSYSNGIVDYVKTLANLIVVSEQFRYLKISLLLKLAQIIDNFKNKKEEYLSIMVDLCLNYLQEKDIAVKILYKGNQRMKQFIANINQYSSRIIDQSKNLKKQLTMFIDDKDKINQITNQIETQEDIPKLLAVNVVQMWEIGVKQRLDHNKIAHKDDALLEAVNLYIKQSITYQDGLNIFNSNIDSQNENSNDAIKQIIDNFLIPNFVDSHNLMSTEQNQQKKENKNIGNSKILSILAEGGSGKSMLLKKLEVELLKSESEYIKDPRAEYIPLIIKCNSLDIQKPSIEKYLEQQNLKKEEIAILKSSDRNKLIMLDGYDEYTGNYFKVIQELKIYEWVNTIVIVTSRLEKISVSDAKVYFNYYDNQGIEGNNEIYTVVKLQKIQHYDIQDYLKKFKNQMEETDSNFNKQDYEVASDIIFKNFNLIQLLKLPINLYLTTRMIMDLNLRDEHVLQIFKTATNQIEIQELFFQEHFRKQSELFVKQLNKTDKDEQELIPFIKLAYFEYFQTIAIHMFKQKGEVSNFLSTNKEKIKFSLGKQIKEALKKNKISEKQLVQNLSNHVDSRVITRIQLSQYKRDSQNNQKNKSIVIADQDNQNSEQDDDEQTSKFEFRHKSIFEYFAARAMKYDFDVHKENIHSLSLDELEKFNINQKLIMNIGYNNSEQQVLFKLFKLIDNDRVNVDYYSNYTFEEIEKNNRYIQYIRKSQILKYDQISRIDTGSSNLLSALFLSKFAFEDLTLTQCSLSKFYNQNYKASNLNFDSCNLDQALLKNIKKQNVESSYTDHSNFESLDEAFSTDNAYCLSQFIFEKDILIGITKQGYINKFKVKSNQTKRFELDQSKQITASALISIKQYSQSTVMISADSTLFLINISNLEVNKIKKFKYKLKNVDCKGSLILVQLINDESYLGNFESGFESINIKGSNATLSKKGDILVTCDDNQLIVYKKLKQIFEESQIIKGQIKITSIILSQNGRYLVTNSNKNAFMIWNVEKGFELIKTIEGQTNGVNVISFSENNKYLATNSDENTCTIWDVEKGFEKIHVTQENKRRVTQISFSQNEKYLAIGTSDKICQILDAEKGFELIGEVKTHTNHVTSVACSPNGKYLVTGSKDETFQIWNIERGIEQTLIVESQSGWVTSVSFSPNSKFLATGFSDNSCKIWNVDKNFELLYVLEGHTKKTGSVVFSANGKYLATDSSDSTIRIWNAEKQFQFVLSIQKNTSKKSSISFSVDGKYLATGSQDATCTIWNAEKNFEPVHNLSQDNSIVTSIAFSSNGKYLATGSEDGSYKIWNVEKGFQSQTTIKVHTDKINSIAFSNNSKYFATSSHDQTCKVWNVEKGFELINSIQRDDHIVSSVTFSSDDKYLITGSQNNNCKMWNLEKRFEAINEIQGHADYVTSNSFSSNGKYFATASIDNSCKIWNVEKGFELIYTLKAHTEQITSVVFSFNGKFLATGSMDNTCKIWDEEQGFELVKIISNKQEISSLCFSNNNKYLATGSHDKSCKVWNIERQFELECELLGHTDIVSSLIFSPNDVYLVTGSSDYTCRVWNVDKKFEFTQETQRHNGTITSIAFSHNSKYMITGSLDSSCIVWDVEKDFEFFNEIQSSAGAVSQIAFASNEKYLVTGHYDDNFIIWNAEKDFELIHEFKGDPIRVTSITFSPGDKYLATSSQNNISMIWNAERAFKLIDELIVKNNISSQSNSQFNEKQAGNSNIQQQKLFDCMFVL